MIKKTNTIETIKELTDNGNSPETISSFTGKPLIVVKVVSSIRKARNFILGK